MNSRILISVFAALIFFPAKAQFSIEPFVGGGFSYHLFKKPVAPDHVRVRNARGMTAGINFMDIPSFHPKLTMGAGIGVNSVLANFQEERWDSRGLESDGIYSGRTTIGLFFYPLVAKFFKAKLTVAAGLEMNVLVKNWTEGGSRRLFSVNSKDWYWNQYFYESDTFKLHREMNIGTLLRVSTPLFRIRKNPLNLTYRMHYGLGSDFNTRYKLHAFRNFFELSYSFPL